MLSPCQCQSSFQEQLNIEEVTLSKDQSGWQWIPLSLPPSLSLTWWYSRNKHCISQVRGIWGKERRNVCNNFSVFLNRTVLKYQGLCGFLVLCNGFKTCIRGGSVKEVEFEQHFFQGVEWKLLTRVALIHKYAIGDGQHSIFCFEPSKRKLKLFSLFEKY